jgi:large subunit ribosomal protein L25
MAETQVIKAEQRPARGKSGARAVRREGRVPGVIYGGDVAEQEPISLDSNELSKIIARGRFLASVFEVDVNGRKTKAIPRDVQLDPVRDTPVHVDFQRIGADNRVRLRVPMRFINEALSPGLKRGGVLNVVRREIEVWSPADRVPEVFEANLEGLEIGRSVHISAVTLPEGVKPVIQGRDFTIATIAGASAKGEAEEGAPGAAAPAGEAAAAAAPAAGGEAKAAPATAAKADAKAKK